MAIAMLDAGQLQQMRAAQRVWVGFSGGLDSSLLLHLLCEALPGQVSALHFNHGISCQADQWQSHCQSVCDQLGVELVAAKGSLSAGQSGLEQQARDARYAFFRAHVAVGDCLALAHHADDQAETLLLRLMRGSGLRGLCGIPSSRALGEASILRPMLALTREDIEKEASRRALCWIQDESNDQVNQDRNWLRHRVLPMLEQRWQGVPRRMQQVVANLQSAQALQDEYVASLRLPMQVRREAFGQSFVVEPWVAMSPAAQRAVLESLARDLGEYGLPYDACDKLLREVVGARADAQPLLKLGGIEVRRAGARIHLMAQRPTEWPEQSWDGVAELELAAGVFLQGNWHPGNYWLRRRRPGDRFAVTADAPSRPLKQLMQEAAVPTWLRSVMPVIEQQGQIVAVAGLVAVSGRTVPQITRRLPGEDSVALNRL